MALFSKKDSRPRLVPADPRPSSPPDVYKSPCCARYMSRRNDGEFVCPHCGKRYKEE